MAVAGPGGAPEPPADVSALYEVQVVPVVAARPHQDAQEVQVVAEVLAERGPGAADREGRRRSHTIRLRVEEGFQNADTLVGRHQHTS